VIRGLIRRAPKLLLGEWLTVIAGAADLHPPSPRILANPFNGGQPHLWKPQAGEVNLIFGDCVLGTFLPGSDFSEVGEIEIYSSDAHVDSVRAVGQRLATALGAELEWFPE
jgi:hypothetical protein